MLEENAEQYEIKLTELKTSLQEDHERLMQDAYAAFEKRMNEAIECHQNEINSLILQCEESKLAQESLKSLHEAEIASLIEKSEHEINDVNRNLVNDYELKMDALKANKDEFERLVADLTAKCEQHDESIEKLRIESDANLQQVCFLF
jgi:hypothetical protein